jgi:hypothetical protein
MPFAEIVAARAKSKSADGVELRPGALRAEATARGTAGAVLANQLKLSQIVFNN